MNVLSFFAWRQLTIAAEKFWLFFDWLSTGLPDFCWYVIAKPEKMYQKVIKYPK
jgi:hypothetical protein